MLKIIYQLFPSLRPRRRDTVMSLNSQNTYTAHVRILCDSEVQEVTKLQECIKVSVKYRLRLRPMRGAGQCSH